jgi:peptide/nickel transport system permease protein
VRRRYRLLASLGLLLGSTFAVFALLEAAPGGPAAAYVQSPSYSAAKIAGLQSELGPGRPVVARYFAWLSHVLRGDLGWSPNNGEPVSQAVFERLPATIELACVALVAAIVLGAIVGFARARARAPVLRNLLAVMQLLGRAAPIIVVAMLFELLVAFIAFSPGFGIASGDRYDLGDRLKHLIAPVLCLAVPFGAWASMVYYDFFRTTDDSARTPARDIVRPIALSVALVGPALLSACLLIEPMFAWPGVARVFHAGLSSFDPGITAGCLLLYCAALVLLSLVAELAPATQERASPHQHGSLRTTTGGRKRINATVAGAIVVLLVAAFGALAATVIVSWDPDYIDQAHWVGYPLAPGVAGHTLGTDENGRDLLSRVLFGLRASLGIAAFAALIASAIAFAVANVTKALRRFDDGAALSVVGIRAFGGLPFVLAVVTVLVVRSHGTHVLSPVVIALIIAGVLWPGIVPAFRTRTSATLGAMVDVTACALVLEFTQSAVGFGVQPPTASLGNMLVNATSNITIAPWIPIVPTVVVVAVLVALYALGDELRERGRL